MSLAQEILQYLVSGITNKQPLLVEEPPGMKKTLRLYHFAASILDSEG
jgi:hypothetical protein